jgi:hypothetical protein
MFFLIGCGGGCYSLFALEFLLRVRRRYELALSRLEILLWSCFYPMCALLTAAQMLNGVGHARTRYQSSYLCPFDANVRPGRFSPFIACRPWARSMCVLAECLICFKGWCRHPKHHRDDKCSSAAGCKEGAYKVWEAVSLLVMVFCSWGWGGLATCFVWCNCFGWHCGFCGDGGWWSDYNCATYQRFGGRKYAQNNVPIHDYAPMIPYQSFLRHTLVNVNSRRDLNTPGAAETINNRRFQLLVGQTFEVRESAPLILNAPLPPQYIPVHGVDCLYCREFPKGVDGFEARISLSVGAHLQAPYPENQADAIRQLIANATAALAIRGCPMYTLVPRADRK